MSRCNTDLIFDVHVCPEPNQPSRHLEVILHNTVQDGVMESCPSFLD